MVRAGQASPDKIRKNHRFFDNKQFFNWLFHLNGIGKIPKTSSKNGPILDKE
jgi:hypothetical protein